MKIALHGPSDLSMWDKEELQQYLDTVIPQHEIVLLAYRSIETEVLKYFINHIELASKLTIYTFQSPQDLPQYLKTPIDFLSSNGAQFFSFHSQEMAIKRGTYTDTWNLIIQSVDLVVSFYDRKKPAVLIPVDEAKKTGKRSFIYYLPGLNEDQHLLSPDQKLKFIN